MCVCVYKLGDKMIRNVHKTTSEFTIIDDGKILCTIQLLIVSNNKVLKVTIDHQNMGKKVIQDHHHVGN